MVIRVCEKIDACIPQCVCWRAGQPRRAGNAAKSGQFIGQFSCVENDTPVLKGLKKIQNSGLTAEVLATYVFDLRTNFNFESLRFSEWVHNGLFPMTCFVFDYTIE